MRTICGGWRAAQVECMCMASPVTAGDLPVANYVTACRAIVAAIKGETEGGIANEFTSDEVDRLRNSQVLGKATSIDPRSRCPELHGLITEHPEFISAKQLSQ